MKIPCRLAIAVFLMAIVIAIAGCTSPSGVPSGNHSSTGAANSTSVAGTVMYPLSTEGPAIYAGDPVVGVWDWTENGKNIGLKVYYTFNADGTFVRLDDHGSNTDRYAGTWSRTGATKYTLVFAGSNPGFEWENLYYSNSTGYLRNEVNDFMTREK
ncbi:MAG TPA: hypothetical protein VK436_08635 [Methanocella sp.]|nr:hypothetical protein [Methanocella sp.]